MSLRKWTSNNQELLDTIPSELTEGSLQTFELDSTTKALGLQWNPRTDEFNFKVNWTHDDKKLTKRVLLSEASKLFDPLGWLAPVIVKPKMLMQLIWITKIDWDDEVPINIKDDWIQFRQELNTLEKVTVPRWINTQPECEITIHGFCDASEAAYAAVVYTRIQKGNQVMTNIMASKTRVAPVRTKITLPKLELNGAVLLGHLMVHVKKALQLDTVQMFAWSDSMITLGWLKSEPNRWKTFVANRVADIQSCNIDSWGHVRSEENPADCASRGIMPSELKDHPLWFSGPKWLKDEPSTWTKVEVEEQNLEKRPITVNVAIIERNCLIEKASSWFRAIRVAAHCIRIKTKKRGNLTVEEINSARIRLINHCQRERFGDEMRDLKKNRPLARHSKLLTLNPFLDKDGLIRVGGRLGNAPISYDAKHPIVLPANHDLTKLVVRQMHKDTLHGGPQLMLGLLRKKYWIIQGKRMASNEFKSCVTCRRFKGQVQEQLMGNLPESRVTLNRAFSHASVDYAGPIEVKSSKLRNAKMTKGYIAVYVCMATKATHLELVSDESTDAFLASFDRFVARRGLPQKMYSDNGTNFTGAANKLEKQLFHLRNLEISNLVSVKGIDWHFIPPSAPHFGGLWERKVRSTKEHLKKTLKNARLTFEEHATVLCQIEACLNSRPLCPLTNDTEHIDALTPGHFLIGEALLAVPQPMLLDNRVNNIKRWNYVQLLHQQFWTRWSTEYLSNLQQRQKWNTTQENLSIGNIVLVKEDNLPPKKWLMGRVTEIHPGRDGQVRVVTVRMMTGTPPKATELKRPITKLCLLLEETETGKENEEPINEPEEASKPSTAPEPLRRSMRYRQLTPINLAIAVFVFAMIFGGGMARTMLQNQVTITPFENNAGIYFENLGRTTVIRSEWHMIVHFNLNSYFYEIKTIQDAMLELRRKCDTLKPELQLQCLDIATLLNERITNIKEMNVLLKLNKHGSIRHKRAAPLNIVGWAAHELFGVMDAEHAEIINKQINELDQNAEHLLNLIKNQTTVLDMTTNLIKVSHEEINRNIGRLANTLEILARKDNETRRKEEMISYAMFASLLIDRIEKVQQSIINMLTELQQGHVSSFLFKPNQVREHLAMINDHIPDGCKLPVDPQHDLRSLYTIMRGGMRVTETRVIIDIILPLVLTADFQIFHLIPIPTQFKDHRVAIAPESKYLLITLQKDTFYQMNNEEFDTCLKLKESSMICRPTHPMNHANSERSQCERNLLIRRTELNPNCKYEASPMQDIWIQLYQKNKWIYDLTNKTTLNIVCLNDVINSVDTTIISGAGLLEIEPGCEVSYDGSTVFAENDRITKTTYEFYPAMNISELIMSSPVELDITNVTIDHMKEIKQIFSKLEDINEKSNLQDKQQNVNFGIGLGTITMVITTTLIGWCCNRRVKQWWNTLNCATSQRNNDVEQGTEMTVRNVKSSDVMHDQKIGTINSGDSSIQPQQTMTKQLESGGCPFRTYESEN